MGVNVRNVVVSGEVKILAVLARFSFLNRVVTVITIVILVVVVLAQ